MTSSRLCFVLIRGLLREARHWGDFPAMLQKQHPGALILTPDIPGNGSLSQLISPKTIAGMTDALREQIPDYYPVRLLALSMGGMIAIDWMNRYPDEVTSAVLINTSLGNISPFYRRLRWQNYYKIIQLLFTAKQQREQLILAMTSNTQSDSSELLADWQQWQKESPVSSTSAKNQLLASAIFSVNVIPNQPILIVSSSADRLVDYRCSLKLQQSWDKDYRQHDTAGHDLPLDAPRWLVAVVSQWIRQC